MSDQGTYVLDNGDLKRIDIFARDVRPRWDGWGNEYAGETLRLFDVKQEENS